MNDQPHRVVCSGDLSRSEQATERRIAAAVHKALTSTSDDAPHALDLIGHTGRSWLYVCRCGEMMLGTGRPQADNRVAAYVEWLHHVAAALNSTCVLCTRRFADTGSTGLRRPTRVGKNHAHAGCATDAALDRINDLEGVSA